VWLWIEDADGNVVANRAGGQIVIHPTVSKAWVDVTVRQPLPATEQTLMVEWKDAEGTHGPESTGRHPPSPA